MAFFEVSGAFGVAIPTAITPRKRLLSYSFAAIHRLLTCTNHQMRRIVVGRRHILKDVGVH